MSPFSVLLRPIWLDEGLRTRHAFAVVTNKATVGRGTRGVNERRSGKRLTKTLNQDRFYVLRSCISKVYNAREIRSSRTLQEEIYIYIY